MAGDGSVRLNAAEVEELASHVLGLRKDYVQGLLRANRIAYSGKTKLDLRQVVHDALGDGSLTVASVIRFLEDVEPGGKQHVYLFRVPPALNDRWRGADKARRRLRADRRARRLLESNPIVAMPDRLQLSRIVLQGSSIEISAVQARRYEERNDGFDHEETRVDGTSIHYRAFVRRVARSTVTLRWDTANRHASVHVSQATGQQRDSDYYTVMRNAFAEELLPFLDLDAFRVIALRPKIYALQDRERTKTNVLTRSRRGRWETPGGAELQATSASAAASVFADAALSTAVGAVASAASGQNGNVYWLPGGSSSPLTDEVHMTLVASDDRVNFMVPTTPDVVRYVLDELRKLP